MFTRCLGKFGGRLGRRSGFIWPRNVRKIHSGFVLCGRYEEAIRPEGSSQRAVFAWGANNEHQCHGNIKNPDGSPVETISTPHAVPLPEDCGSVAKVSAGWTTSFIIDEKGRSYSWGHSPFFGLANPGIQGGLIRDVTLCDPLKSVKMADIACGRQHTLFLTASGDVIVCGNSEFGQAGNGRTGENEVVKVPLLVAALKGKGINQISSGLDHCCALTRDGRVWAWGYDYEGQCGVGDAGGEDGVDYPTEVRALQDYHVIRVECGLDYTAFLTSEGQLLGCGANDFGQLGLGHTDQVDYPQVVAGSLQGKRVVDYSAGGSHMTAITDDGDVHAWGWQSSGRLGDGVLAPMPSLIESSDRIKQQFLSEPVRIPGLCNNGFARLYSRGGHNIATNEDGTEVYTWGLGSHGRLGHPEGESLATPKQLHLPFGRPFRALDIAAGVDHTLMVAVPVEKGDDLD
mmetsp:Transcript_14596/g.41474  ORF Transcript_14596/g.41474 Transcript_14596/m.41474 type:complete len:457 (+) Transcript_14596:112-1482(+)